MKHIRHQSSEIVVYEGDSGLMLGSLWAYGDAFGSLWATLGLLCGHFKLIVGESGGHFWRMKVALGGFGSLWGHSKLTLGLFLAYEDDFGMVIVSSLVYKGQLSKDISFPN